MNSKVVAPVIVFLAVATQSFAQSPTPSNTQGGSESSRTSNIADVVLGSSNPADVVIKSNNAERMRFKYNGGLGIGNTPSVNGIEIVAGGNAPARRGISTDNDPDGHFDFFINGWQFANSIPAFRFKNGIANSGTPATSAADAPDLMTLDIRGTLQLRREFLGDATGATLNWGTSYIGFNVERRGPVSGIPTTHWKTLTDSSHNGAAVIYGDIFGNLLFSSIPTNGTADQMLFDSKITDNIGLSLKGDGNTVVGDPAAASSAQFIVLPKFGQSNAVHIYSPGNGKPVFAIKTNGTTNIGPQVVASGNPNSNALLQVAGKIACKELIVLDPTKWADDVFDSNYPLMATSELESFYLLNKHLPDVPSQAEVKQNGINPAEMDATLLRKVEELTLYVVSQEKRIAKLEAENRTLKGSR